MTYENKGPKARRVALVGAGGTGKSTLLDLFKKDGWVVFQSITREFYDLMGVANQAAYMQMPILEQVHFQRKMRSFYQAKYSALVQAHPTEDIVTDRSIFDHMAYGIYGMHNTFNIDQLRQLLDACVIFANLWYTNLVYIPYPQPWMSANSGEDGFRKVEPAQDYSVASIMFHTLFYRKVIMKTLAPELSILKASHHTPEQNYQEILAILQTQTEAANG